jgi:Plants and Prokaryotes Conserved (PCC) domain
MKSAVIHEAADRTFVLVFDKGDEVVAELTAFAKREVLAGAHFTAIGAFSDATLGLTESKRTTGGSTSASRRKFSPCWAMWRSRKHSKDPRARCRRQGGWHRPRRPPDRRSRLANPRADPDRITATSAPEDGSGNRSRTHRRATKNGCDLNRERVPVARFLANRFSDRRSVDPPELCDDASSTRRAGCHRGDRRWRRASDRAVAPIEALWPPRSPASSFPLPWARRACHRTRTRIGRAVSRFPRGRPRRWWTEIWHGRDD